MAKVPPRSPDPAALEDRLGYRYRDPGQLAAALAHSSTLPSGAVRSGEQLEFLGDAVLDLAVADLLMRAHPDLDEGRLSKCRAALVRTSALAAKARQLGLGEALVLGRGEERSGGRDKDTILAAAYESVLGSIYRDGGFQRARAVVARHFRDEIRAARDMPLGDWKTLLQERTQAASRTLPEYRLVSCEGPPHARRFTTEVWIDGALVARGSGTSKRDAEQSAALAALETAGEGESD